MHLFECLLSTYHVYNHLPKTSLRPFVLLALTAYTPEFIPPASDQLLIQPVDAGAFTFDLLKMFLDFLPPFCL